MTRQRRRDTAPELAVRRKLAAHGVHFRVGNANLPGTPDISNRRRGWAIFVHGCFWHGHPSCSHATVPKRNRSFWVAKVEANRLRDQRKATALRRLGLFVLTIWECQTGDDRLLEKRLSPVLERSP